jgi:hypothetical protein
MYLDALALVVDSVLYDGSDTVFVDDILDDAELWSRLWSLSVYKLIRSASCRPHECTPSSASSAQEIFCSLKD